MVIIKLMGGLGNQFFTYSFAYAKAKELNTNMIIDKQIYHTHYLLRKCEITLFDIDYEESVIKRSFGHGLLQRKIYNLLHAFLLRFKYKVIVISEDNYNCDDITDCNKNYFFSGYWQNYRYFENYKSDLRRQFRLKHERDELQGLIKIAQEEKIIALHVRRGDYVTFKGGKCLNPQYYYKAIEIVRGINGIKSSIWVFTDDVEYAKNTFGGIENIQYVDELGELSDVEQFQLMRNCNSFIIGNSTFSWWAAYLADSDNKIVVAPEVDMWKRDFYPSEWTVIDAILE